MNIIKTVLELLIELIEIIILVGLIASVGISFPVNAEEQGGITVLREVPQRSAVRASVVPGKAVFVDTSPDDKILTAIGTDKLPAPTTALNQLVELDEHAFAGISSNTPQNININFSSTNNIASQVKGSGISSNLVQSTQRINSILGRAGGASITNNIRRATSSIGPSIRRATGFLSTQ